MQQVVFVLLILDQNGKEISLRVRSDAYNVHGVFRSKTEEEHCKCIVVMMQTVHIRFVALFGLIHTYITVIIYWRKKK